MKKVALLFILFIIFQSCAEGAKQKYLVNDIEKFQQELNAEYRNPKETPLRGENFKNFKQHPFFPIDLKYHVIAFFEKTSNPIPFEIPTSSGKFKKYQKYGTAKFTIDGKLYSLNVYQSLDLMKTEEYKDYLFLPFHDATNGKQTYGGGRYLDLKIPENDQLIIDFNKSYHPLCAYNAYDYNCPIVPEENRLPIEIKAGVMYDDVYFH